MFDDTWEWDGIEWTEVDIPGPTDTRGLMAMAYDPKRHMTVIFGGSSSGPHENFVNSTWEYIAIPEPKG